MKLLASLAAGVVILFCLICLSAREKEEYKVLKLMGYFLISTLGFKTSNFVVPTGVIFAGLIMYRDRANRLSKILVSGLGLSIVVLNLFYTVIK
ncbi:hypothetical protein [Desulfotruncus alcoholivorax]|uniref:hypothetical protein n=1 Tax=Desulfotruncus alcoholivorax TaxID=265477 RepID=UPI0003FB68EE|nr:hypothetical protein [Desulfotruncus alcoholivorax]